MGCEYTNPISHISYRLSNGMLDEGHDGMREREVVRTAVAAITGRKGSYGAEKCENDQGLTDSFVFHWTLILDMLMVINYFGKQLERKIA